MFRRWLPRSLHARVMLIVILPIFLMQTFVTYVFFDRHWDLVSANLSANVVGQIALVTELYREARTDEEKSEVERRALEDLELSMRYQPAQGVPVEHKRGFWTLYNDTLDRQLRQVLDTDYWFDTRTWPAYVEIRVQVDDGYLVYQVLRDRVFATTGPIFVLWLVGATVLLGWIALVFLKNQVRSILKLAAAAEAFGRGRDMPDFRPSGATEVRRAGFAFLAMRERIKRQIHQRTAALAAVSHDLKTPLTRLRLALAMQPDSPDVEAMRADALEMERMVEGYLDFARDIAAGEPEPVDVGELLGEVGAEAKRGGGAVECKAGAGIIAPARRDALKRAVGNLVENGLKYASRVWLSARRTDGAVEIVVDDDGPGIDPKSYDEALKPFVRLPEGEAASSSGVGLGLAVVREVARTHGGEVSLDRAPQGGLRAVLKLPS
jgi:two-component system osmolarity sensor histidine kinase EnvZ